MEPQRVFAEKPVSVDPALLGNGLGAEKTASLEDLVELLASIRREAEIEAQGAGTSEEESKKRFNRLWSKYTEFAREFPLIFRWTVYNYEFEARAFRAYIRNNHKPMWKDRREMLKAQSEYLVHFWRIKNPRAGGKALARYRTNLVKKVLEEQDEFEEAVKECEEIVEENKKKRTERIREALAQTAREAAARAAEGGPN